MKEIFDTKNSLNKVKYLPLYGAIAFPLPGIYLWFRSWDVTLLKFVIVALWGFSFGLVAFFILWLRYGNTFFEITDDYISRRNGDKTIRSVRVKDVEYYFYRDREKFPKLKVRNEKDFGFEMTLGANSAIVCALEKVGIKKKV